MAEKKICVQWTPKKDEELEEQAVEEEQKAATEADTDRTQEAVAAAVLEEQAGEEEQKAARWQIRTRCKRL